MALHSMFTGAFEAVNIIANHTKVCSDVMRHYNVEVSRLHWS